MRLLFDPALALLFERVHVDALQRLKEVEGVLEDRYTMPVSFLGQNAKPFTTGVPLGRPLLIQKALQLVIRFGQFLSFFCSVLKARLTAGEDQVLDLAPFVFHAQSAELLDVLLDQRVPRPT